VEIYRKIEVDFCNSQKGKIIEFLQELENQFKSITKLQFFAKNSAEI
jgi:hypothetical protein